jgi:hypothetical protein
LLAGSLALEFLAPFGGHFKEFFDVACHTICGEVFRGSVVDSCDGCPIAGLCFSLPNGAGRRSLSARYF